MLFSIGAAPLCTPTQSEGGFHFPYALCNIYSLESVLTMAVLTGGRGFVSVDLISIDFIMSGSSLVRLSSKESACSAGDARDLDLIPEWGRSPGEGKGNPTSTLSWKISWAAETSRLQSMGLQKAGRN